MLSWLSPPSLEDEYEHFAAQVLHYTLLVLMGVIGVFLFFVSSPVQLLFLPVCAGVLILCFYLVHSGRHRIASALFVSGLWSIITIAAFSINGIRNASIPTYCLIIIFAAVLIPNRAVLIFTGLSIASVILLTVGERAAILPLSTTLQYPEDRMFQLIALFAGAGILLAFTSKVIRFSVQRARANEATLSERNKQLEQQMVERQRTLNDLRVTEERYRLLFENISVMAAVYSRDGDVEFINSTGARMVGATPSALQGRNLREFLGEELGSIAIHNQQQALAEGKDVMIENHVTLPNGREVDYLRHIIPLPADSPDMPPKVLVITTDLTEERRAEHRERELILAKERSAFLTDFFNTLSHDLKTPLATIHTSLYLAKKADNEALRAERIDRIADQTRLIEKYIQDMLTVARLEHLPSLTLEKVDIHRLLDRILESLQPRIEAKSLTYRSDKLAETSAFTGNYEQLERLMTNLIENAINYTHSGGEVRVSTQTHQGDLVLRISDTGIGIEAEAMPYIFQSFYRTSNAKALEHRGTGLGLAIVKKIADVHGMTIEVDSVVGEGTTFTLTFPVSDQNEGTNLNPSPLATM